MQQSSQPNNENLFDEFPSITTQDWENKIIADLKGADYEKCLIWKPIEGFSVKPYYRAEDIENLKHLKTNPGEFPYLRGKNSGANNWEIRQDINTTDTGVANKIAIDALSKGADAVGFRIAKKTENESLPVLLKNIDVEKSAVHFNSASSYPALIDALMIVLVKRDADLYKVKGSFNFDPLSYLLLHGNYYTTPDNDFVETAYVLQKVAKEIPNFKAITINGHIFHNAGATSVQELSFSLASANEYITQLKGKGFNIDAIAPYFQFSFAIGSNYFFEIAKLRAARLLWAKMIEVYAPLKKESMQITIHSACATTNKTIYDPHVNMLRVTTEAMSAAIGGCDSLSVIPFDAVFANQNEFSSRIARNLQLILKGESYLDKVLDIAAGSYYIETLTDQIAAEAWKQFQTIEEKGGYLECLKNGYVQEEIQTIANKRNLEIGLRKQVILGTNQFPNLQETMLEKVSEDRKKIVFKDEKPQIVKTIHSYRGSEAFEELRLATEAHVSNGNKRPQVFLFTFGKIANRKTRAAFSSNFFGCAGFEIIDNIGFDNIQTGIDACLEVNPEMVILCSSDTDYAEHATRIATALKLKNKKIIVMVAGNPTVIIDTLKSNGVDDFIHIRSNIIETLKKYHSKYIR